MRGPAIVAVMGALLLGGCVSNSQQASNGAGSSGAPTASTSRAATNSPATTAQFQQVSATTGTATPQVDSGEYRLAPRDLLEISVFQVEDLTKTVEVNSRGEIALPLIGNVQASGRTASELEQEIARKLGESYLQSPQVSVFVKEYRSQMVTVEGAVNKPGVYEVPGSASLLQVIAKAEGIDRVGDPSGVTIFHNQNGKRISVTYDVIAIRKGQVEDPHVVGGDTVVVNESGSRVAWRNVRESAGILSVLRPTVF